REAANAFRAARAPAPALDAFRALAGAWERAGNAFHAARALESAGDMARELRDLDRAVQLYEQAATALRLAGNVEAGAQVLVKAADALAAPGAGGGGAPLRAAELYHEAGTLLVQEERQR